MASLASEDPSKTLHKIYTSDPIAFKRYVNKRVVITTHDSHVHTGIVYTVDPVSESFILMQPREGEQDMHMKIIVGSSIKDIDSSSDTQVLLPEMFVTPRIHFTPEELDRRKDSIMKLLLENRFPATEEEGVLCIEDTVKIEPPYLTENCICTNSIILNRIQALLACISV